MVDDTNTDAKNGAVSEETSIKVEADSKGRKHQATIEIEQGSKKLKVKMPFHKSSSTSDASEGDKSDIIDDKKKKKKSAETKLTTTTTTTSISKANKEKKTATTTTMTRSNSVKRARLAVASDSEPDTQKKKLRGWKVN